MAALKYTAYSTGLESSRTMKGKRKGDHPGTKIWFHTDRMINENGQWYFATREGTIEGPFSSEVRASEALEAYIGMLDMKISPTRVELEPKTTRYNTGTLRRRQLGAPTLS